MERGTEPKAPGGSGDRKGPRGSTRSKLTVDEERTVKVAAPPRGARFKGYTSFLVQDLVIRPHVVNFCREHWLAPDGKMVTAPLPARLHGHFGPQLRRFVLAQYHQGQVTVPRLVTLLRALGTSISKRQVMRLLNKDQDGFLTEARDLLRAGLASAPWITVDDTGARHKAVNGFCTQIGNEHFAWFGTTTSKSRSNFLALLRAGHGDYVVNAEALAYMRRRALAGAGDRPLGRTSAAVLQRSGRLERPSRPLRPAHRAVPARVSVHLEHNRNTGARSRKLAGGFLPQQQEPRRGCSWSGSGSASLKLLVSMVHIRL